MNRLNSKIYLICLILSSTLLSSCGFFSAKEEKEAVARVGDKYLYLSDIINLTLDKNSEDSAVIAQSFIDTWIKEQLLLEKAQQNLSQNQLDFEKQLENYRNSLIVFAYENQLIQQKLDTVVTEDQINAYFRDNRANFELRTEVLKARFLKFINTAPHQDSLLFWLKSGNDIFTSRISEYCAQFALSCVLDTSTWIPINVIRSNLPMGVKMEDLKLSNNSLSMANDSTTTVILDLFDWRSAGEIAPASYVENQIVQIIRNKRRLKLLADVKEEIFEEATIKGKYEVY